MDSISLSISGETFSSFNLPVFSSSDFNLKASDPRLLLNLCASLGEQDAFKLQQKVNKYIQLTADAKTAFIININNRYGEAVVQVVGENVLPNEYRFGLNESAISEAVLNKTHIALNRSKLDKELLTLLPDDDSHTFLNIPIEDIHGEIVLLCCVMGYNVDEQSRCVGLVTECFRYCLGAIKNTLAYEEHKRLHEQSHTLLAGARNLISHLGDLTDLVREVMTEVRTMTRAERCSLFLIDEQGNLVSKVFDGVRSSQPLLEVKIKAGQGIAGHVAQTGALLNIKDAYAHPLFYKNVDIDTGFRTKNILCFPIVDERRVIGVAELCNKINAAYFDVFDEEVAMAFSVYCGITIMHSLVYKKIQAAQARNKLSNELMMYYMKVNEQEVQRMIDHRSETDTKYNNMDDFQFVPRNVPRNDSSSLCLKMFDEIGFIEYFHIPDKTLARFIAYAKKGYRNNPYHNWSHAFAVHNFIFLVLKKCNLIEKGHITRLEGLALLVAAMCHDIDHRGTNNQFQMLQDNNSLAKLYSSEGSVMERHHVSQTMCILNTEGCNIIAHLDESVFKEFIDLISQMILATDLVVHLSILGEQTNMVTKGFNKLNDRHRYLLRCILITCADISDQVKDFEMSKEGAVLIYEEFFRQGDLEKTMGVEPMEMMDRDRANIPELQTGFLSSVVVPLYEVLVKLYPEMAPCLDKVKGNLLDWKHSLPFFENEVENGRNPIDILLDKRFEETVQAARIVANP